MSRRARTFPKLTLVGWGLRSGVGLNALQCAMAVRARQYEPCGSTLVDSFGHRITMGLCREMSDNTIGWTRLCSLIAPAVREAYESAGGTSIGTIPLLLGVRPPRVPVHAETALSFFNKVATAAGVPVDANASRLFFDGKTSFLSALTYAEDLLQRGAKVAFVGAVDSPLADVVPPGEDLAPPGGDVAPPGGDVVHSGAALASTSQGASYVAWLDKNELLFSPDRPGGRMPGEAGAVVALTYRQPRRGTRGAPTIAFHAGAEPKAPLIPVSISPYDKDRMVQLLHQAAARLSGEPAWVLPDVNNEPDRIHEWAQTQVEAREAIGDAPVMDLLQHIGDLGAAHAPAIAIIASMMARTGAVPLDNVLLPIRADDGRLGMFALELPRVGAGFRASVRGPRSRRVASRSAGAGESASVAEVARMNRLIRSCLEDIGSMAILLNAGPQAPSEAEADRRASAQARLLENLDVLAAVATPVAGSVRHPDLLGEVGRYGAEVQPPDTARRFATAFALAHLGRPAQARKAFGPA